MKLFETFVASVAIPQPLAIVTPLGALASSIVIDGNSLTVENSSHFSSLEAGGFAARWESSLGTAEVIISRPSLTRESWAELTDCWAFLWRFKALQKINNLVIECSWKSGYTWKTGGPESGQGLDAQTWDDAQTKVSLGTEDGDKLFVRAEENDWLPRRFTLQSTDQYSIWLTRYLDEGMAVHFGEAHPSELFQAHYVVAWSPYDEESIAPWDAVDLNAEHILEGAAGRTEWQPKSYRTRNKIKRSPHPLP